MHERSPPLRMRKPGRTISVVKSIVCQQCFRRHTDTSGDFTISGCNCCLCVSQCDSGCDPYKTGMGTSWTPLVASSASGTGAALMKAMRAPPEACEHQLNAHEIFLLSKCYIQSDIGCKPRIDNSVCRRRGAGRQRWTTDAGAADGRLKVWRQMLFGHQSGSECARGAGDVSHQACHSSRMAESMWSAKRDWSVSGD